MRLPEDFTERIEAALLARDREAFAMAYTERVMNLVALSGFTMEEACRAVEAIVRRRR